MCVASTNNIQKLYPTLKANPIFFDTSLAALWASHLDGECAVEPLPHVQFAGFSSQRNRTIYFLTSAFIETSRNSSTRRSPFWNRFNSSLQPGCDHMYRAVGMVSCCLYNLPPIPSTGTGAKSSTRGRKTNNFWLNTNGIKWDFLVQWCAVHSFRPSCSFQGIPCPCGNAAAPHCGRHHNSGHWRYTPTGIRRSGGDRFTEQLGRGWWFRVDLVGSGSVCPECMWL